LVAEPAKSKLMVTATVVADESVAVTVSLPPSSANEVFDCDKLTVGSPVKVALTDDGLPAAAPTLPLPMLTVRPWLLEVSVSKPVSVVEPVVWPEAIVIEAGDAE
jgi:hypothetical protein